jgi:DNA phosphorothioation-dependent restriction protein DptG
MTTYVAEQKKRDMENFNNVVALYTTLKHDTSSLRIKQAIYRADEVQAQPLDFVLDIES